MTAETEIHKKLQEVKEVKNTFLKDKQFAAARAELSLLRIKYPSNLDLAQQLAVCTYKDMETAPAERYAEALQILQSIGLGEKKCDAETLRLGGAVYKRKWQFDGRLENLYQAYSLYSEAADSDPQDYGYGAVNAAFILDLLSARSRVQAKNTGTKPVEARRLKSKARTLREKTLPKMAQALVDEPALASNTWFYPTYAEVHFGLGIYDEGHYAIARDYLQKTVKNGLHEWESETSFRQLVSIAKAQGIQMQGKEDKEPDWHPAWQALSAYLGKDTHKALECYRGRVGLALSGGGFRASFYHIGVLARLAEMDVLSSVEVLSTVSGGSIVGALYYLEVKHLLEHNKDADIKRQDYIDIVERIQQRFFSGVKKNLRMRTFLDFKANFQMLNSEKYSHSHRIGSLYEQLLYNQIGADANKESKTSRTMSQLKIHPAGDKNKDHFNPVKDNWRRSARAPILLINATSLNSGHNWRFTADWMGEPPGVLGENIDKNQNYEWVYYDPAKGIPDVPLGNAVAASACVPGLFEPLEFKNLYPGHTVKLVDGGVHDNQGIAGLLDLGCTLILCSDASGQMNDCAEPSSGTLRVPLRSNDILMDRVRESQYQNLAARVDSRALEGLFFTHLKDDLDVKQLQAKTTALRPDPGKITAYGIHSKIQRKIAALRTDLDCFSEVEANALMLSGYKMTEWHFNKLQAEHKNNGEVGNWGDYEIDAESVAEPERWTFLDPEFVKIASEPPAFNHPQSQALEQQLEIGESLFLKAFKFDDWLRWGGYTLLALFGAVIMALLFWYRESWLNITVFDVLMVLVPMIVVRYFPLLRWFDWMDVLKYKGTTFFVGIVGAILGLVQVRWLDNRFLQNGSMEKLKNKNNR